MERELAPAAGRPATTSSSSARTAHRIIENLKTVIHAPAETLRLCVICLVGEGHLIIEDFPGVGKTMLAKALARSIDASVRRVQFTPDLLPSDITGVSVYNQELRDFEFRPGAVFANVVVGDEINRASPKTQSALLECMAEHQVTVDGVTYGLASPFLVVATQNPIEMDGTYPLPEAQRDRFTARVSIGYPDPAAELTMLDEHAAAEPLEQLRPVADAPTVQAVIEAVRRIRVGQEVRQYCVDLVTATRRLPDLRLGASPRATLQLVRAARAQAALQGRGFVTPDDVRAVAVPVLAHRLLLAPDARAARRSTAELVHGLLTRLPVPAPARA